jgi:hypothetical protein
MLMSDFIRKHPSPEQPVENNVQTKNDCIDTSSDFYTAVGA